MGVPHTLSPSLSPRNHFGFIIFMTFRVFGILLSLSLFLIHSGFEDEAKSKD